DESGIKDIKRWAKTYKQAEGYYHMDTDGVTSGIAMKAYLEAYGIKTVAVHKINYGSSEFAAVKAKKGRLIWMVDFAHGKPFLHIHTDHHEGQTGTSSNTSTAFEKAPSNVQAISQKISPRDLFSTEDIKVISTVDSADFARNNISPDQVMSAAFGYDKTISVEKNHMYMGLVVNKLLLAYKNKPGFLDKLVMTAKPSLMSMYNVIKKLASESGYKTPAEVGSGVSDYVRVQKGKIQLPETNPTTLKSGESTLWGTTIVQYGGGGMFNGYDRYTPFKNSPDADFIIITWPMGLVQCSKNPFKTAKNSYHLGDIAIKKVLGGSKWKTKLSSQRISLSDVKRIFEMDIKPADRDAMGFKFEDFAALMPQSQVKGITLDGESSYTGFIRSITAIPFSKLSYKQKQNLQKITVSVYDIMVAQSGGHKDITNVQGFNFLGKGFVVTMKEFMVDLANEMKDKRLEP
ncbi:MAG: hypothetical protein KAH32_06565, partial [Chlamydiia bacterium]|nr:hypothetical protein [Chlamydiia bacterium]